MGAADIQGAELGLTPQTLEARAQLLGADLVLEGGGVKGIGLAGAVLALHDAGYVFPRIGGTSAGAIVAALVAAYQVRGVDLHQLERDMRELDYPRFTEKTWAQRHLGVAGDAAGLLTHQGVYATGYLRQWLAGKLEPLGIRTFADLKITDDDGTGLPAGQRYRLVTHASDLSRGVLVRLPWDLPYYLLRGAELADEQRRAEVIDSYPVADAVRASMSIPYFFQPFIQQTALGSCTWVDGGMLQNFPVTVFDRTDGQRGRWPTFGIKLSSRPSADRPDVPVHGDLRELLAIAHTALGEWNRYPLADSGVGARTVFVDTMHISSTDFGLTPEQREQLFASGTAAAEAFLAAWAKAHPPARQPAGAPSGTPATVIVTPQVVVAPEPPGTVVLPESAVEQAGAAVVAEAIEATASAAGEAPRNAEGTPAGDKHAGDKRAGNNQAGDKQAGDQPAGS